MSNSPTESELIHYGVKGMKWGVSRSDAQIAKSAAKKEAKAERKEASKNRDERIKEARRNMGRVAGEAAVAEVEYFQSLGSKKEDAARKAFEKADYTYVQESRVANSSTRGEAIATGIISGVGITMSVASIALLKGR